MYAEPQSFVVQNSIRVIDEASLSEQQLEEGGSLGGSYDGRANQASKDEPAVVEHACKSCADLQRLNANLNGQI